MDRSPLTDPRWALLRAAERHPERLRARVRAEIERGGREFRGIETGEVISQRLRSVYTSPTNLARFVRLGDLVLPGDDVVEIGTGRGLVATTVVQAGATRYRGIELDAVNVRHMRSILSLNGVDDRAEVRQGDLYDITAADLEGADLVICSEVVEHVPDPERALAVLGECLPEGAYLLWTVPILGQLEQVWGHLGVFDAERIAAMCAAAGLTVQHVEPLAGVWASVLVSKGDADPARVARLRERVAHLPEARLGEPRTWTNLSAVEAERVPHTSGRGVATTITVEDERLVVSVPAPSRPRSHAAGGVAFACSGVAGVRLELEERTLSAARKVTVDWFDGEQRLGSWTWVPGWRRGVSGLRQARGGAAPRDARRTIVIRPGVRDRLFGGRSVDVSGADRVELTVHPRWPLPVELAVRRVGWLR